jgi:hypothetical protein
MENNVPKLYIFGTNEIEFWRREFKASVEPKDENYLDQVQKLINHGIIPIIQVGPATSDIEALNRFSKKSIIIHLFADETYTPYLNFKLIRNPAIATILRPYPIPTFSLGRILSSNYYGIRDLLDNFKLINLVEYFRINAAGFVMLKRQLLVRLLERFFRKPSVPMPLGYNDLFSASFCKVMGIESDTSLIFKAKELHALNAPRKFNIGFVGQTGKLNRKFAISAVQNNSANRIILRDHYGGAIGMNGATVESGVENVETLLNSKFALCPPGNYSSFTFRLAESIVCGAFPLYNLSSFSDPISTYSYLDEKISRLPKRWKSKVSGLQFYDQGAISDAIFESLEQFEQEITRIKDLVIRFH